VTRGHGRQRSRRRPRQCRR